MDEQRKLLEEHFENEKSKLKQVDDFFRISVKR